MGMVAKCTRKTANPIGRGAKTCHYYYSTAAKSMKRNWNQNRNPVFKKQSNLSWNTTKIIIGCLQGRGSLGLFSWHQWQRRQCRRGWMCRQSQHQGQQPWCSLGWLSWHRLRTYDNRGASQGPWRHQLRRWLPSTASPCRTPPLSRKSSSLTEDQMSLPGLCDPLQWDLNSIQPNHSLNW